MIPFEERRRQQFLYEKLYENNRAGRLRRIEAEKENLREYQPGTEGYVSCYDLIYRERFWLWMLDYTAGVPIEELAPRIAEIVDAFEEWDRVFQDYLRNLRVKFPEDGPYEYAAAPDFDVLMDYEDALQLLSVAILLRDIQSVKRIIHLLRWYRGTDALLEELIECYVTEPRNVTRLFHDQPYRFLVDIFTTEDDPAAIQLLKKYLKAWYPAMKDHPRWYDGHRQIKDDTGPYYGYWAFEAGAAVYLLDLDDSQIDHMVYPKDLVAYGKKLREDDRWTSPDNDAPQTGRVAGGQPCPRAGYWETPAKLGSRRYFKEGELMPVFAGADYGATIWGWSTEQ